MTGRNRFRLTFTPDYTFFLKNKIEEVNVVVIKKKECCKVVTKKIYKQDIIHYVLYTDRFKVFNSRANSAFELNNFSTIIFNICFVCRESIREMMSLKSLR